MAYTVQHHASALRNRVPIAKQLHALFDSLISAESSSSALPVLEVGSGTGAHVELFAQEFPQIVWQPTEHVQGGTDDKLGIIDICGANSFGNVRCALALDASLAFDKWPKSVTTAAGSWFAVFCSNVCHIAPWEVSLGLFAGAGAALRDRGMLITYGPYKVDGEFTTESNREFDASLRARNPSWGYRDIADLKRLGLRHGLELERTIPMPANNFMLVFVKTGASA